jgi:hypothetical protein
VHKPSKILIEDAIVGAGLIQEFGDAGLPVVGITPGTRNGPLEKLTLNSRINIAIIACYEKGQHH